jgi:glycosyltransferase involved in cell wall biosynthesis
VIIHAYIYTYNVARILDYSLRYYSRFCDKIFVYDNGSTDNTKEICAKYEKACHVPYNTDTVCLYYDEQILVDKKSTDYKQSRGKADWAIIVDTDELLYHPDLLNILQRYKDSGIKLATTIENFIVFNGWPQDPDLFKNTFYLRSKSVGKCILVDPSYTISYGVGCHTTITENSKIISQTGNSLEDLNKLVETDGISRPELYFIHFKILDIPFLTMNFRDLNSRRSPRMIKNGWGYHYNQIDDCIRDLQKIVARGVTSLDGYRIVLEVPVEFPNR